MMTRQRFEMVSNMSCAVEDRPAYNDCVRILIPSETMSMKVRKAVFPAAGMGTRFLPATKVMPKEMLPVVDKPIIQYGVEEAIASGCDEIIIVTGRGKVLMEDHFDISFELEHSLAKRNKSTLLETAQQVARMAHVSTVPAEGAARAGARGADGKETGGQ